MSFNRGIAKSDEISVFLRTSLWSQSLSLKSKEMHQCSTVVPNVFLTFIWEQDLAHSLLSKDACVCFYEINAINCIRCFSSQGPKIPSKHYLMQGFGVEDWFSGEDK